jgi:hypothetical protein
MCYEYQNAHSPHEVQNPVGKTDLSINGIVYSGKMLEINEMSMNRGSVKNGPSMEY